MDWELAACRDHDPELFFPLSETGPGSAQVRAAKAICQGCPIQRGCLQWAMDTGQEAGVWGGTTEDERRAMRRARRLGTTASPRAA
jgi:WhiB family redox-sensing transcriptional regulator